MLVGALKLIVHHRSFFNWQLVKTSDLKEGDAAIPSHMGPEFSHVQVQYNEPNTTEVGLSESELEHWAEDHQAGVVLARKGYDAVHVGGSMHGQKVAIAPRNLPLLTRNELLAKHLADAVFPFHFPSTDVTKIEVTDTTLEPEDAAKLERFLNRRFVLEENEDPDTKPKGKK